MKIETVMWSLPVAFMLHDFEEIVMMKPWLAKNAGTLRREFPKLASRLLPHFERLSTSSFAMAVAEEFFLLSLLTLVATEFELYALWAGALIAFFLHILAHLVQLSVYRRYAPVALTSLASAPYCLLALSFMDARGLLVWRDVAWWTVVATAIVAVNLVFVHRLAGWFDSWLDANFRSAER